jgi:hypothetical protein
MSLPVIGEQHTVTIRAPLLGSDRAQSPPFGHVANVPTSDFSLKCKKTPTEVSLHQF